MIGPNGVLSFGHGGRTAIGGPTEEPGFKTIRGYYDSRWKLELTPANLPRAVKALLNEGWQVEAEVNSIETPDR